LAGEDLLAPPKTGFYGLYEIITSACLRTDVGLRLTTPARTVHALPGLVAAGVGVAGASKVRKSYSEGTLHAASE
jgi:hypothetical protein